MPNLRTLLDFDAPYHTINREERNLAALLYHALLLAGNLERFLRVIDCPFSLREGEGAMYFEYALLRDLWRARANEDEARARRVILESLRPPAELGVEGMSVEELNRFFGVGERASKKYIQTPGKWSIKRFKDTIEDDAFFLAVCRFKWCFNIKPDLVIQLGPDEVVCIEAKLESPEGSYPATRAEIAEFERRGLARVKQTELQKHMFESLLGMKAQFVFLVAEGAKGASGVSETHGRLTWGEAFGGVEMEGVAGWVTEWVGRV